MPNGVNRFFVVILGALLLVAIFLIASPSHTGRSLITRPSTQEGETPANEFIKRGSVGVNEIQKGKEDGRENLLKPFEPITDVFGGVVSPPATLPPPFPPPKEISDAEMFAILYPPYQIDKLHAMRNQFIAWGWMQPKEPGVIRSEADLYPFLENMLEVAIEKNFYKQDQLRTVRASIKNYHEYLQRKKAAIRKQQASIYRSFDSIETVQDGSLDSFFATVLPFWPSKAEAQDTIWQTSPLCFKNIVSSNPVKGIEPYSFCCNCGIKWVAYVPVPMLDCGPFAGSDGQTLLCDVHLGCLNNQCEGFLGNAMWDGVDLLTYGNTDPTTNKCGCDEPQKVYQNQQEDQ